MTNEELIIVARSHCSDMPALSGESWANLENLTDVKITDTVTVSFENERFAKKIVVVLDRNSGRFLGSRLSPREWPA